MFDFDKWQEIFHSIWKHKWRTLATAFGVYWGILMLVLLLGAGQGLQNGVLNSIVIDATNSIWFFTGRSALPYKGMPAGRWLQYHEDDIDYLRENIEGIEYIAAENTLRGNYTVHYGTKSNPFRVVGAGKDYFQLKVRQDYVAGRKLNLNDNVDQRKVCVVGTRVRDILFGPEEDPIGKYISIKGLAFRIVGVFHDESWGGRVSEWIYVPFSTFQRSFNPDRDVTLFAVTTAQGYSGQQLEKKIMTILKERHLIHPEDNQAFWSHNQEETYQNFQKMFFGIKTFVWLVGIGTLIAGIVGVSNIMLVVVRERTNEIGIRKAMGATPYSIIGMIVSEALVITSIAGYLGLITGVALLFSLDQLLRMAGADIEYFQNPQVNFKVALIALFILILAGVLAGLFPARRAARINPVEALRS